MAEFSKRSEITVETMVSICIELNKELACYFLEGVWICSMLYKEGGKSGQA